MQLTTLLALAPLLGAVVAVPRQAHEKFHHKKRDITWFTVTSEVVETVYETTTVWVAPGQASPSAAPSPASPSVPAVASPSPPAASPSPPAASPSPPAASPSPPAASPSPPAASPSVPAAPSSSGLVGLQSPPAVPSPSPQSPAPVQSPSPAPASPSSAPAAQPSQPSSGGGGGSFPVTTQVGASVPDGPCTPDQPCSGDGTFYDVGTGACGGVSSPSDMIVAVPVQMMGSLSSGNPMNPLCGRKVMVQLTSSGPKVEATVVDKCGGCTSAHALDMSRGLFAALGGDENHGRYEGMQWYWTS